LTIALSIVLTTVLMTGCSGLFNQTKSDTIIKHPDAAMLILSASGTVRVGIYDAEKNEILEYGTLNLSQFSGWTIHKFNWEKFIENN